jgi:hypothetical protein
MRGLCLSITVKVRPSLKVTETRRSEKAAADSLKMFEKTLQAMTNTDIDA